MLNLGLIPKYKTKPSVINNFHELCIDFVKLKNEIWEWILSKNEEKEKWALSICASKVRANPADVIFVQNFKERYCICGWGRKANIKAVLGYVVIPCSEEKKCKEYARNLAVKILWKLKHIRGCHWRPFFINLIL